MRIGNVPIFRGVYGDDLLQCIYPTPFDGKGDLFADQTDVVNDLSHRFCRFPVGNKGVTSLHVDSDLRGDGLDFQRDASSSFPHGNGSQVL